jgi:hypothetical protein
MNIDSDELGKLTNELSIKATISGRGVRGKRAVI